MLVTYKTPFKEIFESLWDDVPNLGISSFDSMSIHNTKVTSNDDEYRIDIAVPGLTKEDIKITTKEDIITILYEKNEEKNPIFVKPFKKTYTIPSDVDEKKIEGKIENGVIHIVLPKNRKKAIERLISLN